MNTFKDEFNRAIQESLKASTGEKYLPKHIDYRIKLLNKRLAKRRRTGKRPAIKSSTFYAFANDTNLLRNRFANGDQEIQIMGTPVGFASSE